MADPAPSPDRPVTPEDFLADRMRAWGGFTGAALYAGIGIAILLILMRLFLV